MNQASVSGSVSIRHAEGPFRSWKGPLTLVALCELCLNVVDNSVETDEEVDAPESSRYVAPPGPRRTRVTTKLQAEIVAQYQRGWSSQHVADTCGIAKSTVLMTLRSENVPVRPQGVRY
jgi:hypothetical protein